ncbi:15636_t:CDS:2, partial [Funneliformis caledonium]
MKNFILVFVLIILVFSNLASSLSRQGCISGYNECAVLPRFVAETFAALKLPNAIPEFVHWKHWNN